jgi:hypothetical protein
VTRRTILVVEDGTEYVDAFRRLAPEGAAVEWLHAQDAAAARCLLGDRQVDAIFLDVVFDRTPPDALVGDLESLIARYSGDRGRALAHLADNQGFYVAADLAPAIPPGVRVLLAYDFTPDPARLAALRESVPGLEGVEEGVTASTLVRRLLHSPRAGFVSS